MRVFCAFVQDGFIPNLHPAANNGKSGSIAPIAIGMEVLCRDAKLTCGAFYEGKIVDASLDGKWVCKLNRGDIEILPFVKPIDIRPLCFAKAQDYIAADEGHWPGKHPHPNWRKERGSSVTTGASGGSECAAFCEIPIAKSGTCPNFACLGQKILLQGTQAQGSGEYYFTDGAIGGIFLLTPPEGDRSTWPWRYAVANHKHEINPQWGPLPSNIGSAYSYIVPKTLVDTPVPDDTGMYGQMVICNTNDPTPTLTCGATPPGNGTPDAPNSGCGASGNDQCPCYSLGTIFNVPSVTSANGGDGQYHSYTCTSQETMKGFIQCGSDTSAMWKICYPAEL